MADVNRQLLDSLLGPDRNTSFHKRPNRHLNYYDDPVCKRFLVSVCYNELWKHTKYDTEGECTKKHDNHLKIQFVNDQTEQRYELEKKYIQHCIEYIEDKVYDVDKVVKKHQELLEQQSYDNKERPKELVDRLNLMDHDITRFLKESEKLGEMGKFEDSERMAQEAEKIKKQKEELIQFYEANTNPIKAYRICEICGGKQFLNETEQRIQLHVDGKIHQGFLKLRSEQDRLQKRLEEIKGILDKLNISKPLTIDQLEKKTNSKDKDSHSRSRSRSNKHKKKDKKKKHRKHKHSSS